MPTFTADKLHTIAFRILSAAGLHDADADIVAGELKKANLAGHDSHGVIRLMQYVDYIEQGFAQPTAQVEVITDRPAFAVIDGHFAFGQIAAQRAVQLGLEKAGAQGTATIVIRNCNHVGRLGSYSQQAAQAGFATMMAVDAPGPGGVAPFGGMDRRLGTNPISMAVPWGKDQLVLDMTSSATAEGKLRVAFQKGESVPEGWIINATGQPTIDPAEFYADPPGAILPLGGPLGFKGFGLSVMIDMFAGILSGSGVCRTDLPRGSNGVWMYFLDISQFVPREQFDALVVKYVDWIKSSRTMPGVEAILMPGEIEKNRQMQREAEGIVVAEETWRQLSELATRIGADLSDV